MTTQCYALLLLVVCCSSLVVANPCFNVSWAETFSQEGLSGCGASHLAINGFYRGENSSLDPISGIEEVKCCQWDDVYEKYETVVVQADWKVLLERQDQWVRCPPGFVLEGLYRTGDYNSTLEKIDAGRCVKPSSHPYHYEQCYDEDISESFNEEGYSSCRDGFFVTGFFRGPCPELHCLDKLRCCQMSSEPILMESLETVKIRMMEDTLVDISYLAHYLGYGNAGGCRTGRVGQDFRRNGDTWEAVTGEECSGSESEIGFSIEYRDWKFGIKDMIYSDPIIESITPEVVDSATIYNKDSVSSSHTIRRTEESVTTVTHTKTSSWSSSHEAGIEITTSVDAFFFSASATASYKFSYSNEETREDSESNEQMKTFEVESSKEIPPNSGAKWYLVLSKTRTTISYTAAVLVHFSVRLRGFLRSGGGYYGETTNFHYTSRGWTRLNYDNAFGDYDEPFYTALKKESERNSRPWMWSDMQANYNYQPEDVINDLIDEDRYVFFLTGKFEIVSGSNVVINWEDVITGNEKNETSACGENEPSATEENETSTRPPEEYVTSTESQTTTTPKCYLCNLLGKRKKRDVGRSKRESVGENDNEVIDEGKDDEESRSDGGSNSVEKDGGSSNNSEGSNISRNAGGGDNTRNNAIIYPNEKTLVNAARVLPGDPPPIFPPPPPMTITKRAKKEREPIPISGN